MSSQTPSNQLTLPSAFNPDTLDVLSELANILTRLRTLPTGTATGTPSQTNTPAHATPTPISSRKPGTGELTLKDIPVATGSLKHQFQKTRGLLKTQLPDLDRTVKEQEAELEKLEERIRRQGEVLRALRDVGGR
ncbi:RNA polymerase II transcription mediator complex subunit 9-domain-containing protein [Xylariaceae sp. FL1019]|nr:RNA polymerase II transcription mediator complex subunit 9-domain-containing protein [Xylariaceae sp. FL1019]